ncbi:LbtU family siderophore porin [Dongshaea marina]|uniref:LbtU family siderophore porin n=1 Tax=Dongshaea marina TaxID=2047966 RepID=UPI00131F0A66|nr:LbtU family siderophore porin [Dongshaea marina]
MSPFIRVAVAASLCSISIAAFSSSDLPLYPQVGNGVKPGMKGSYSYSDPELCSNGLVHGCHFSGNLIYLSNYSQHSGSSRWTHDQQIPNVKLFTRLDLVKGVQLHALVKYNRVPSPVMHQLDLAEAYLEKDFTDHRTNIILGKRWLPFGDYSSELYLSSLPKKLGHTDQTGLSMRFNQGGWSQEIYSFRQDTRYINAGSPLGYGANLEFKNSQIRTGIGYINALNEASLMQYNLGTSGFYHHPISSDVPAMAAYANFKLGQYYLNSSAVSAIESFDSQDLSFNGRGAKPGALSIEGGYHFSLFGNHAALIARSEMTQQMLSLRVPKDIYTLGLNYQLNHRVLLQLAVSRSYLYGVGDTASQPAISRSIMGTGGYADNALLAVTIKL